MSCRTLPLENPMDSVSWRNSKLLALNDIFRLADIFPLIIKRMASIISDSSWSCFSFWMARVFVSDQKAP